MNGTPEISRDSSGASKALGDQGHEREAMGDHTWSVIKSIINN